MCGILGIISSNQILKEKDWLKKNISKLLHRGPDNSGIWNSEDNRISLGHTRLSIIDLSYKNNQPLKDDKKKVCLTFNGEIYNFLELREELIALGHKFITNGDTEVLLKSYIEWGEASFKKIEGMFSFCICDQNKKKVYLVRDQYGQKPLYYKHNRNELKFGSEIKILIDENTKKIDTNNLNKFLYYGFSRNETLLNNIYQVPPGSFLEFDYLNNKLRFEEHWDFPKQKNTKNYDAEYILKLLEKSISSQLRSDVSIGFLLSGGIDSSLLVSLASQLSSKKIKTFTVSSNEKDSIIENDNAMEVSKIYNTEHYNLKIDNFNIDKFFNILEKFDEPIIDSSIIPTYSIYEKIKNDCKVVFGGDGGDEIFGGYNHYKNFLRIKLLNKFTFNYSKLLHSYLNNRNYKNKGHMYLPMFGVNSMVDIPNHFNQNDRISIFKDKSLFRNNSNLIEFDDDLIIDSMKNSFKNYLSGDIMFKIDRCSMLHSLEARTPYLDKR